MRIIRKISSPELHFLKPAIEKHPKNGISLEFLIKTDAVAALLLNHDATKIYLVKQYRPGVGKEIYEIPAGLIEYNENPKIACFREIEEETGYSKDDYKILYETEKPFSVSPGYTEEKLYFYIFQLKRKNIQAKKLCLDKGEDLEGAWFPTSSFSLDNLNPISFDLKTTFAYLLWKSLDVK